MINRNYFLLLLVTFQSVAFGARTKETELARADAAALARKGNSAPASYLNACRKACKRSTRLREKGIDSDAGFRKKLAYNLLLEGLKEETILWQVKEGDKVPKGLQVRDLGKFALYALQGTSKRKVFLEGISGSHRYDFPGGYSVEQTLKTTGPIGFVKTSPEAVLFDDSVKVAITTCCTVGSEKTTSTIYGCLKN